MEINSHTRVLAFTPLGTINLEDSTIVISSKSYDTRDIK